MNYPVLAAEIKSALQGGLVIPAHPLALDENRKLDEERQRLLMRYYMECGTGGIAVGVHTTQFEIRDPSINLYEPVLKIAAEEISKAALQRPFVKVAGITGETAAAVKEAGIASKYGYHLALLSMGGLNHYSEDELIERAAEVAKVIPLFGFYLQPAVGGRILSFDFWKKFADIPNVYAIKVAAFNRYQTIDVVRAVCESERRDEIALYTGNDDNIVADLLTAYSFTVNGARVEKRFVGGLLGHWAVWTRKAVDLLNEIKNASDNNYPDLLKKGIAVTDMNAVIFDAKNAFHGCIPGIHEILRRQGLLNGLWCLNPKEWLSEGQLEEIDRVVNSYPELIDDAFVKDFLAKNNILQAV